MTELICNFIDFILELVSLVYPDISFVWDFLANISSYLDIGLDLLLKINFLIPVPLIMGVLFVQLMLRIAFIALYIINWIIRRVFDVIP